MTSLALFERAFNALAEAESVDVVLSLLDEFAMAKTLAQRLRDHEMLAKAMEWELRGERRLGEVIRAAKAAGLFRSGRQVGDQESTGPGSFPRPTLEEAGIDKHLSSRAQQRAKLDAPAFEQVVVATRERIASGRAKIVETAPSAHTAGRITNAGDLDYSPTCPWATRALFEHVLPALGTPPIESAWEPACGEGHIAEVLREYVPHVLATDIHDYGYGDYLANFLDEKIATSADWIITNPPFEDRVLKFMSQALNLSRVGVAMFLQLRYLEGVGRYEKIFKNNPPTIVAPFVERVPLLMGHYDPEASTTTAFMWLVWVHGAAPQPTFWIPPGCRDALTREDDAVRFTQHPVSRATAFDRLPMPAERDMNYTLRVKLPAADYAKLNDNPPAKPAMAFWEHA